MTKEERQSRIIELKAHVDALTMEDVRAVNRGCWRIEKSDERKERITELLAEIAELTAEETPGFNLIPPYALEMLGVTS
jgi:hypothetical protein